MLATIAIASPSDQTRVAAVKELLDRGYGKPTQVMTADISHVPPPITQIKYVIVDPAKQPENSD